MFGFRSDNIDADGSRCCVPLNRLSSLAVRTCVSLPLASRMSKQPGISASYTSPSFLGGSLALLQKDPSFWVHPSFFILIWNASLDQPIDQSQPILLLTPEFLPGRELLLWRRLLCPAHPCFSCSLSLCYSFIVKLLCLKCSVALTPFLLFFSFLLFYCHTTPSAHGGSQARG